jgi:phosphopantothenoylcysteine decarboxylase
MNIIHGLTGSVATIITHKFCDAYQEHNVKWVQTESAKNFEPDFYTHISPNTESIYSILRSSQYDDQDEWSIYNQHQKVLHIELVDWADCLVIAPCSANTLSKIANGLADNLISCVARAWDFNKRFIIAPSMNTRMWEHPVTQTHIDIIQSWGVILIEPQNKMLFCGSTGVGAMADVTKIVETATQVIQ